MIPVVFINCSRFPFVQWIMDRMKVYETRSRNMLGPLVGQRVLLSETGNGRPIVRCSAVIRAARKVEHRGVWNLLRDSHCVPAGSTYDWTHATQCKWLYFLGDVQPVSDPFNPPEDVRHGRVWMEYHGEVI